MVTTAPTAARSRMQSCSAASVRPSTCAVASSRSSTSGVRRMARASAIRWRWPPLTALSVRDVSSPSANESILSSRRTARSTASTSASVASGWVKSRLSRIVPGTTGVSCST